MFKNAVLNNFDREDVRHGVEAPDDRRDCARSTWPRSARPECRGVARPQAPGNPEPLTARGAGRTRRRARAMRARPKRAALTAPIRRRRQQDDWTWKETSRRDVLARAAVAGAPRASRASGAPHLTREFVVVCAAPRGRCPRDRVCRLRSARPHGIPGRPGMQLRRGCRPCRNPSPRSSRAYRSRGSSLGRHRLPEARRSTGRPPPGGGALPGASPASLRCSTTRRDRGSPWQRTL